MDVKCGNGAFMKNFADAKALAQSLVANGNANGVKTEAVITRMDAPLGVAIGNALEVQECTDILANKITTGDLRELSLDLSARMVLLAGKANDLADARTQIDTALSSGAGLEKWRQIIIRQGGDPAFIDDPKNLPIAKKRHLLKAERGGFITAIHAESFGRACMMLGAGRSRVDDVVDPAVGAILLAHVGQHVHPGGPLAEIHYQAGGQLGRGDVSVRIRDHAGRLASRDDAACIGGFVMSTEPNAPTGVDPNENRDGTRRRRRGWAAKSRASRQPKREWTEHERRVRPP